MYSTGLRHYLHFCQQASIPPSPLLEHALCMLTAQMAREGLTHQTIKSYLSAVRHYSVMAGLGDPFMANAFPLLQYVLQGIKRSPALAARHPRLPITPAILRLLKSDWNQRAADNSDYIMLWAACCTGFFGFMRAGEFTVSHLCEFDQSSALCTSDISFDSHSDPTIVRILLRQSKTDPFRRGVAIYLGRTGRDLCPVTALLAFIAIRPEVNGPLFVFKDGSFLTRDRLVAHVRQSLSAAGIDTKGYSGHSFRIGAATTAAMAGIEDSSIKILGRWESSAYQCYLQTPRDSLAAVSAQLTHVVLDFVYCIITSSCITSSL